MQRQTEYRFNTDMIEKIWDSSNHHEIVNQFPNSFLDVPKHIYTNQPWYTPESTEQVKIFFSGERTFYQQGSVWLGVLPGQARLAGFIHPSYGEGIAYFGYWETQATLEPNQQLFAALERWALSKGSTLIKGPICFNTFGQYRLQLDHFNEPAFLSEPGNPDYYPEFCESLGYTPCNYYTTIYSSIKRSLESMNWSALERFNASYNIKPLDAHYWQTHRQAIFEFIEETFGQKTQYSSIPEEEFDLLLGQTLANQLCPHSSFYAENEAGKLIGLAIVFPHFGEISCQKNEQPIPNESITYEAHFSSLSSAIPVLKVVGVSPDYQDVRLMFTLLASVSRAVAAHYDSDLLRIGVLSEHTRKLIPSNHIVDEKHYALFSKKLTQNTTGISECKG